MIRRLCGMALLGLALIALAVGCGPGYSKVEVKVELDGAPVDGATVVFMPEDGKGQSANGITNASGVCTLSTGEKSGVLAGKYKPLVTKTEGPKGVDSSMSATDAMKKAMENNKGGPPGAPPAGKKGMGGMPMPGGAKGSGGGISLKQLLPAKYADSGPNNPLGVVTVPPSGTVTLSLSAK